MFVNFDSTCLHLQVNSYDGYERTALHYAAQLWTQDDVTSLLNLGANIGNDVLYSGTVGAALGGRKLKFPPIAISSCEYKPKSLEFIANKSCELVELITSFEKQEISNKVVNINFPDVDEKSYKGIKVVPIAKRDVPPTPDILKNTDPYSFSS